MYKYVLYVVLTYFLFGFTTRCEGHSCAAQNHGTCRFAKYCTIFLCNLNKAAVRIELSQKWFFFFFFLENTASDHRYSVNNFFKSETGSNKKIEKIMRNPYSNIQPFAQLLKYRCFLKCSTKMKSNPSTKPDFFHSWVSYCNSFLYCICINVSLSL